MCAGWILSSVYRQRHPTTAVWSPGGDTAYINCIRSIQEPELEYHFYRVLHRLGLPVKVESNMR